MSMYTQLLEAAWREHQASDRDVDGLLDEVLRRRRELDEGLQAGESAETVPAQLALQIGYDVALMDLARCSGIDTEPSHFEQPQQERERLEHALRERGIGVEGLPNRDGPMGNRLRELRPAESG